ncbi:diuretic hormone receptor-like [Photinus pyralis]|uniref:diuretic hormone receptor-like n=1 Tax=Photinus pyralis TaxID=7054 RepID=UPI001266FC6C|nr:diuretic hormone receptor-like [Photinus pyralis]
MIEILLNPFSALDSEYKRLKYFENSNYIVKPVEHKLGVVSEPKRVDSETHLILKNRMTYRIPLSKTLKLFLELPDVYKAIRCYQTTLLEMYTPGGVMSNLVHGSIYQNIVKQSPNKCGRPAFYNFPLLFQMSLQSNKGLCILLTILLHYFHLTNFFWMFVEGLYLHILVVKTFTGDNIKLPVYAIIGWGCPMVFVLIWGITRSFSPTENDRKAGEIIRSCPWTPHVSDWIYQVPAMAVLLSNVVFMGVIMWVLITKLRSANSAETQQYRKAAKALLVLIPLLGITYILVIVGPAEDGLFKSVYDIVRAVLLSTQGFTVALFYCFLNTEVKNTVRHRFNSWHARRTVGSQRESRYSGRDWSQRSNRSRGESLRLYNQSGNMYRKRESTCSDATTTTVVTVATTGKQTPQIRSPLLPPPGELG